MIIKVGNTLRFGVNGDILEEIPKGNWLLLKNGGENGVPEEYYLEKQPDFVIPEKIYGDLSCVDRYKNSFEISKGSLGVWLSGRKGNGKTVTAKMTCIAVDNPVIIISQPFIGGVFQNFLGNINQEITVLLDEFEKVYSTEEIQAEFLPILEGVFSSKKLFIFTTNSDKINKFMKSRPGRIRYHKAFEGLSPEIIQEIVEYRLENQDNASDLKEVIDILGNVSTDILIHLIDEMNLYNESAKSAVKHLNIQVEHTNFEILGFIKGSKMVATIEYNPLTAKYLWLYYRDKEGKEKYFSEEVENFNVLTENGEFKFQHKNEMNTKFIFTPIKTQKFTL